MFQPLVRWSGGKRKQSEDIINMFPYELGTLYVPFLGGGSILYQFVNSNIKYDKIIASDLDEGLMNIWNLVQNDPQRLLNGYTELIRQQDNSSDIVKFYDDFVYEYNKGGLCNPIEYFFIIRCCGRGSILYDRYGNFCTPMIANSPPARPETIAPLLDRWTEAVQGIVFKCEDYISTINNAQPSDYVFLDPPYIDGTWYKHNDMDWDQFWHILRGLPCDYSMTLNGDKETYPIPKDLYTDHKYIYYGISTSSANGNRTGARDSLWIRHNGDKYDPDRKNIRANGRPGGGKSNSVTEDTKAIFEMNDRMNKLEGMMGKILNLLEANNND